MRTLPARFAHFAASTPDAVAVTAGDRTLTYAQLDARSNRLARRLIAAGAGPERIVGVSLPRSAELIVALLAVLKSGAAYLPLDPAYPMARLDYLVSDARPVGVIAPPDAPVPGGGGLPRFELLPDGGAADDGVADGGVADGAAAVGDDDRLLPLMPDHPAYVIYTSGSTGLPKGVVVSHQSFLALLDATTPLFDLNAGDVWTVFHSYAFDFSVWEIWGPLLTGGRTVVVPADATWSAPELLALLAAERVTILNQTPSSFASLDRADDRASVPLDNLRLVIFGGESLDPARLGHWFARRGNRPRMVNMYGITETTVHVTARDIPPDLNHTRAESPIGRPLPGFRDYVYDHRFRSVEDDEAGELYLGGAQLARGYLGRPGLTATRFIANPNGNGDRLYRTGDLVQRARVPAAGPQGEPELFFIGRADSQLSLRGFRIEPGEIEAALDAWDGVTASAVAVKPDPDGAPGDECLVAYAVTVSGGIDERALRGHLARTLPSHLVPSHIVPLPALPLTPNRKLDRAALPPPPPRKSAKTALRGELIRRRLAGRPEHSHEENRP